MRDTFSESLEIIKLNRRRISRFWSMMLILSLVVSADVFWMMRQTGITLAGDATCGIEEHSHGEECYEGVLTCSLSEEEHTHADDCYESIMICEKEEHTHSIECYADETADVETQLDWQEMFEDYPYSGTLATDLVGIAKTQLGYTESSKNFIVDDGGNQKGYTRYGAWYGSPYGDWSAMFVSYCLHYAGSPTEETPYNIGANSMAVSWEKLDRYVSAGDYTPIPGDLIFFKNNTVGIVVSGDSSTITFIQGDVDDAVCKESVAVGGGTIAGYGLICLETEEEEPEEQPQTEETPQEETKVEDTKTEEPKEEETKIEDSKTEEPQEEDTKKEEPKEEETKVEDSKTEEPKEEDTKKEEPKEEETKVEDSKTEDSKDKSTDSTEVVTSTEDGTDETKPVDDGTTEEDTTPNETIGDETAGDETTGDETTGDETTGDETSGDGTTEDGTSGDDTTDGETPEESTVVYSIKVHAKEGDTGREAPLAGATFGLYTEAGELLASAVTDSEGNLTFVSSDSLILESHTVYYLLEISAPIGYGVSATKQWFCFCDTAESSCTTCQTLGQDKNVLKISLGMTATVEVMHYLMDFELPSTGGMGILPYMLLGGFLILTPMVYMMYTQRRWRERGAGK